MNRLEERSAPFSRYLEPIRARFIDDSARSYSVSKSSAPFFKLISVIELRSRNITTTCRSIALKV